MLDVEIKPVGDAAVLAVLGDAVDPNVVSRVWSLARALRQALRFGILDIVPAYASVLVRFDPFATDSARVMAGIRGAAETAVPAAESHARRLTIGVAFGAECGIDLERTAHELGMREARLRETFCKPDYRVAFIGFLAGFPYLLGLAPALHVPRLPSPRPRVPSGSVAIAGGQCGIYPRSTPGGWRILGRTNAPLFDPLREPPALLAPGDVVRFIAERHLEDTGSVEIRR